MLRNGFNILRISLLIMATALSFIEVLKGHSHWGNLVIFVCLVVGVVLSILPFLFRNFPGGYRNRRFYREDGMGPAMIQLEMADVMTPLFPEVQSVIYPKSLTDLRIGYINYLVNEKMRIGVPETVTAEVFLDAQILDSLPDTTNVEQLFLSKKMSAKLLCKEGKFEITPLNREVQPLLELDITKWKWDVKPLRSGAGMLELVLSVAIAVEGIGVEMKDLETYRKDITVRINPAYSTKQFLNNNWQWLVGLLVGSGTLFSVLKAVGIIH